MNDGGTIGEFDKTDTFTTPASSDEKGDAFTNDLDLFLMPAGATDFNDFVWASSQEFFTLEHLFVPITTEGNYELWVRQFDDDLGGGQDYGLAWWGVGVGAPPVNSDFDGDGTIDGDDLAQWQGDYGLNGDSDANGDGNSDGLDFLAWQRQFGTTPVLAGGTNVPEPTSLALFALAGVLVTANQRKPQQPS